MQKQNPTENSLDLEANSLRGQLDSIKKKTKELHQDLVSISKKVSSLSKQGRISEDFKKAAEREIKKFLEKVEGVLNILGQ